MTVLSVAQKVASYIGMDIPDELMASTEREHIELREVLQEAAEQIAFDEAHDWQLLTALQTETGDGSTSSFSLPTDFRRFGVGREVWTSRLQAPLEVIPDLNVWREIEVFEVDYLAGAWALFNDQIHVKPTPEANELITYYYQSDLIVTPESGANKARFTADADTFRLSERLLKLCGVWLWKKLKRQSFMEDYEIYRRARAGLVTDDKPTRVIRVGGRRFARGVKTAYPRTLT